MKPGVVIDPRLPADLAALLDAHEVPHEEGALLWELEKRGYEIALDGPDATKVTPEYRWCIRVFAGGRDEYGAPRDRKMFHAQTARIALALAFQWAVSRDPDALDPSLLVRND